MRKILISSFIFPVLLLSSCVYVADVQQGNVIDKEELDQLKVGMTKKQVKFLLGTPIIKDAFHKNRWDYVYTLRKGDNYILEQRRMKLEFKGDKLSKIDNRGYPNPPLKTEEEDD
ncbi:MAG: outer membrane protein assembly factor BamE [Gammaproteobacteria bacterium]|nr:outer membrane protein assembly factor BamE [Gammaproteobacteria bacterium]